MLRPTFQKLLSITREHIWDVICGKSRWNINFYAPSYTCHDEHWITCQHNTITNLLEAWNLGSKWSINITVFEKPQIGRKSRITITWFLARTFNYFLRFQGWVRLIELGLDKFKMVLNFRKKYTFGRVWQKSLIWILLQENKSSF